MMSRRTMIIIIIAMSLSIIGIGVIQIFWFKASVEQESQNFNDKVMVAMGIIKDRLLQDAQTFFSTHDNIQLVKNSKYTTTFLGSGDKWDIQRREWSFKSKLMSKDAESYLQNIDKKYLDLLVHNELEQQGIKLDFDYGVYSSQSKGYVILNGNYVVSKLDGNQNHQGVVKAGLHNTDYSLYFLEDSSKLGSVDYHAPGYLKIFFPKKNRWLWRNVLPSIILSVLFTSLLFAGFVYTLYTIIRQKHVSQMKTDFINNMTHEFKTPIATISLATDSIDNPVVIGNEEKIKRFTKIIKQENERMLNQVEKVLQIAMIDNEEFQLKTEPLDIHELIGEAVSNIQLKVDKREGVLETQLNAQNPIIMGDKTHISNIINNLLDNSEKYSPDKLYISVNTMDNGDYVSFKISDKGQGMTKEHANHIFEKFYRAHTGNVHDVKGFGLGLSYVKAIVDAHKGQISVSTELGKGTSFTVKLPKRSL